MNHTYHGPTSSSPSDQEMDHLPFDQFLSEFKATIKTLFKDRASDPSRVKQRDFEPGFLAEVMRHRPLSVAIPSDYGGRGADPRECIAILEAASYESVPLTLIFGINMALFIEPLAKYGQHAAKATTFNKFLEQAHMGGLMITEPDHGSDALNMKSHFMQVDTGEYSLKGTKHWQGLTGMADHWLVAAREMRPDGALNRDLALFLTDDNIAEQHIVTTERFNNPGLYPIPYGLNKIEVLLPKTHRLIPDTTGIKMLMDTLHRSRLQFPGMALGFLKRAYHEARHHCEQRMVRGKSLRQYDQVEAQLAKMEAAVTVASAMCHWSAENSAITIDLSSQGAMANTFKAVVSDLMQDSAQTLMQLLGSKGYHESSLAASAIMDTRPFQIFEGPNDMLFTQLSEILLKSMSRSKEMNLLQFMRKYEHGCLSAEIIGSTIDVTLEKALPQRKLVLLGRAMAKIILAHHVIQLGHAGYNAALIDNAIQSLHEEIACHIHSYSDGRSIKPTPYHLEDSDWLTMLP